MQNIHIEFLFMKTGIKVSIIKKLINSTEFNNFEVISIDKGVSTDVFKLSYKSTTLFLRVLPKGEKSSRQVIAHRKMIEKGVNVPEVIYFADNINEIDGCSYMILKEIKGDSIRESRVLRLNDIEKIIIEAGKQIALVNTIEVNGVGWIDRAEGNNLFASVKDYDDFAIKNLQNMLIDLVSKNIVSKELSEKIFQYIDKNKQLFDIKGKSFLAHGDFGIDHIYQNDGKFSGIIDFGDIRGTSKFYDISHVYTFNNIYFEYLIKGYNEVYKLPNDYLERVKLEAVLFGVGKLWWIAKNRPDKISQHPVYKLFDKVFNIRY